MSDLRKTRLCTTLIRNSKSMASPVAEVAARQWAPDSWRKYKGEQMATYEDAELHSAVMDKLSKVPGLVLPSEVDSLTNVLAAAGRGERFIVQGGDCAERFMDCEAERISAQLAVITQMGAIVQGATGRPAVRIARMAGQYGKPRSKPTEKVEGWGEIYSFKGDNINGFEPKDRAWDPKRLLDGYWHSAATMNCMRSIQMAADATSQMVSPMDIGFLKPSPRFGAWSKVAAAAKEAAPPAGDLTYTAHEAMQLDLESALTRNVAGKGELGAPSDPPPRSAVSHRTLVHLPATVLALLADACSELRAHESPVSPSLSRTLSPKPPARRPLQPLSAHGLDR